MMLALPSTVGLPGYCLGRTAAGQPRHPLYLRGDVTTELYP